MMLSLHEQLKEGAMLLRGFATADASSLIEEAAFFEDLFLSNGRFDAGNHFYDNAVTRPLRTCPTRMGKHKATFGDSSARRAGIHSTSHNEASWEWRIGSCAVCKKA